MEDVIEIDIPSGIFYYFLAHDHHFWCRELLLESLIWVNKILYHKATKNHQNVHIENIRTWV